MLILTYFSLGDPEWVREAKCHQAEDDVFFAPEPETDGTPSGAELGQIRSETAKREVIAKTRYCSLCPSQGRCALEGFDEEHGIWGGWSPWERAKIKDGTYRPSPVSAPVSARRDQAVKLIRDGLSVDDVATKMEISPQAVSDYLRQNWVLTVRPVVTESDV